MCQWNMDDENNKLRVVHDGVIAILSFCCPYHVLQSHDEKRLYFSLHYMELYGRTVHFIDKAGIQNQAGRSMYDMQRRKGKKGRGSRT